MGNVASHSDGSFFFPRQTDKVDLRWQSSGDLLFAIVATECFLILASSGDLWGSRKLAYDVLQYPIQRQYMHNSY